MHWASSITLNFKKQMKGLTGWLWLWQDDCATAGWSWCVVRLVYAEVESQFDHCRAGLGLGVTSLIPSSSFLATRVSGQGWELRRFKSMGAMPSWNKGRQQIRLETFLQRTVFFFSFLFPPSNLLSCSTVQVNVSASPSSLLVQA